MKYSYECKHVIDWTLTGTFPDILKNALFPYSCITGAYWATEIQAHTNMKSRLFDVKGSTEKGKCIEDIVSAEEVCGIHFDMTILLFTHTLTNTLPALREETAGELY